MKQKIIPILSVLVGLLAFVLTAQYLRSREKDLADERARLYAGAKTVRVLAAAHDIPGQTVIKSEDLGFIDIFESSAPDRVILVDQLKMVIGRKSQFEIKARKPVLWTDIEGGSPSQMRLASRVVHGMRAISLSVGGPEAVSGMVEPNDRVDVLGTFSLPSKSAPGQMETVTLTVLQDVTVLAVGQRMADMVQGGRSSSAGSYRSVTLAVTARESEVLMFAEQVKGRLALSLRNPDDASFEKDLPEVNFQQIEKELPELNLYRQRNIHGKRNL